MNDTEISQLQEVRKRMDRLEMGQDEILQLLRGPLDDPTRGLVASVRRVEEKQREMQIELSQVRAIAHAAPCPFLAGAEVSLGEHL